MSLSALRAAAERLLAGTPLRSISGKLTGSELITESALRRDVVYGNHKDLVEENTKLKADLAAEREKNKVLAKVAVDLSGTGASQRGNRCTESSAASGISGKGFGVVPYSARSLRRSFSGLSFAPC
ncbi:hypothetical protein ACFRCG_12860 [Embleya sp. NPDC056575]|uniref:hypothetical protein n=1 Tax=unclassified Embleya TaxID=2699296 RepID=UPI0036BD58C6